MATIVAVDFEDSLGRDTLPETPEWIKRPKVELSVTRTVQTLGLLTLLALALPCCASAQIAVDHPTTAVEAVEPPDPTKEAADKLLQTISEAVIGLDATGDRTSEAIADSMITLTLAPLQDSSQFSVLCLNGGEHLRAFTQSLIEAIPLQGQAVSPACSGTGHDSDPFKLQLHLHREGGHSGLFQEQPLLLPVALLPPEAFEGDDEDTEPNGAENAPSREPAAKAEADQPTPLNAHHIQTSHAVMLLPPGWSVSELPKPVHSDSVFAAFDRTVTFSDRKLVTDQQLLIKKEKIEVVERPAFEKLLESSEINEPAPAIRLESTLYFPPGAFDGTTDDEKKAATLINAAFRDIQSKNLSKAEADLKQAEALDPGHEILHDNMGMLAAARGDYEAALVQYQEELRAFPNALIVMESIAGAQRKLGRTDDAIATLQRWMAADPNSTFPVIQLMYLYHDMGRDDLAVTVGDQAMNTMNADGKRSVRFLRLYGHEQMLAGQPQAAKVSLETLLNYTSDIQFVNEAAYDLSEKGFSLDRAEETVRASLTQFDPDGQSQMPHMFAMDAKQQTSLMLATWDTLGWILYNKGRFPEAEAYIRAAWRSRQDPAIGRHLGALLSAEEKPIEALDAYKLALATIPGAQQEKAAMDPDVVAIHAEIERLEKLGHKSTITDPAAALQKLRVLDAGPAGKQHGEGEYNVMLSASEIVAFPTQRGQTQDGAQIIGAIKLPADFFPPESHAQITKEAKLNCTTVCTLTLLP